MRRAALAIAGLVLLALAVGWTSARPEVDAGLLTALGRSMGGLRVLLVDVLFLRAERLRREGRVEEVPALYEAVRDLDPGNTVAVDHLAAVYAYDLLAEAPDLEARTFWWRRAWDLVESALEDHPDDASLFMRASDLLLEVTADDPGLEAWVASQVDDPRRLGLERLLAAARLTPSLPRRGRTHLMRLALIVPLEAGLRLLDGREAAPILALGDEALAARSQALAMVHPPVGEKNAATGAGREVPLDEVLRQGLRAVRDMEAARRAGDTERAEAVAAQYVRRLPLTNLGLVLEELASGG